MSKDVYQVIYNPHNLIRKYELWVAGKVVEWTGTETGIKTKQVVRCVKSYFKEQQALEAIKYWQSLQHFKEQNSG